MRKKNRKNWWEDRQKAVEMKPTPFGPVWFEAPRVFPPPNPPFTESDSIWYAGEVLYELEDCDVYLHESVSSCFATTSLSPKESVEFRRCNYGGCDHVIIRNPNDTYLHVPASAILKLGPL